MIVFHEFFSARKSNLLRLFLLRGVSGRVGLGLSKNIKPSKIKSSKISLTTIK